MVSGRVLRLVVHGGVGRDVGEEGGGGSGRRAAANWTTRYGAGQLAAASLFGRRSNGNWWAAGSRWLERRTAGDRAVGLGEREPWSSGAVEERRQREEDWRRLEAGREGSVEG